jgi:hypothetical protein
VGGSEGGRDIENFLKTNDGMVITPFVYKVKGAFWPFI